MEYVVPHRAGPGRGHAVFYELGWTASCTTSSWRGFGRSWRGDGGELTGAAPSTESSSEQGEGASARAIGGVVAKLPRRTSKNGVPRGVNSPAAHAATGANEVSGSLPVAA